jgi:hypothetical protein
MFLEVRMMITKIIGRFKRIIASNVEIMVMALCETCLIKKEGITRWFYKFYVTPEDGIVCQNILSFKF